MKNYLNSSNVTMYPSALRGGTDLKEGTTTIKQIYDPESRLTTEANITSLVNRLSIDGSFVISSNISSGIEISLHGYFFKITAQGLSDLTTSADTSKPIYAVIKIKDLGQTGTAYTLRSLVPYSGDNMNLDVRQADTEVFNFQGLYFTQDQPATSSSVYCLKMLEYSSSTWSIPHDSILRFNSEAVKIAEQIALHDVIYKNGQGKVEISADEFKGHLTGDVDATTINANEVNSHLTGNVKGDVDGNSKTATDATYASTYGTSSSHGAIGAKNRPVYVDSTGKLQPGIQIYVNTSAPSDDIGNDGDIWFQYKG